MFTQGVGNSTLDDSYLPDVSFYATDKRHDSLLYSI